MPAILLVDDDPLLRNILARFVLSQGHSVSHAESAESGIAAIKALAPDLVITDMEMPGGSGFAVLDAGLAARIPVVILTAHASVQMAVDAMRRGAANFLSKPFSAEDVQHVLADSFVGRAPRSLPATHAAPDDARPVGPVGDDEAFRAVLEVVDRVADTDATILVTGESGTGKEVVARAIHNASKRRDRAFVPVNCGAIPDGLLESELFGHVRGAFTGATQARRGRFQVAEGGTLFLDEIGDMQPVLQVKLLRVLQDRVYEILGDSRPQPANVRFIAATHRDLDALVDAGTFRQDLYYRLNVVPLHLPPLRERTRDIPLLVAHFIAESNAAHHRCVTGARPEVIEALAAHSWPGNIRELSNIIERMTVLRGKGMLEPSDVPEKLRSHRSSSSPTLVDLPSGGINLAEALQNFEGLLIAKALERTHGNRTQAAGLLRINRTTLVEKLKRRDNVLIDPEEAA